MSYQKYLAWTLGAIAESWKEMILQLIEASGEERHESAEVQDNYFDVGKAARKIRLHELQEADRVFERRAHRPDELGRFDQLRSETAARRMNKKNGFAAVEFGENHRRLSRRCFFQGRRFPAVTPTIPSSSRARRVSAMAACTCGSGVQAKAAKRFGYSRTMRAYRSLPSRAASTASLSFAK